MAAKKKTAPKKSVRKTAKKATKQRAKPKTAAKRKAVAKRRTKAEALLVRATPSLIPLPYPPVDYEPDREVAP